MTKAKFDENKLQQVFYRGSNWILKCGRIESKIFQNSAFGRKLISPSERLRCEKRNGPSTRQRPFEHRSCARNFATRCEPATAKTAAPFLRRAADDDDVRQTSAVRVARSGLRSRDFSTIIAVTPCGSFPLLPEKNNTKTQFLPEGSVV